MKRGAIIGLGSIGQYHLKAAQDLVEIVAVCDADSRKLTDLGSYARYQDCDELLAKERLDFIDICLPHAYHLPVIEKALERGLDVLCEKPLVSCEDELASLERSAKGAPGKLVVNYSYSYSPQFQKLKEVIDSGAFGAPRYVQLRVDLRHTFWDAPWRSQRTLSGGGVFLDDGIHLCYLARMLAGADPVSVHANIRTVTFEREHVDDYGHALFEFANGCVAEACCTAFQDNRKSFSSRRVECEKAALILPYYSLSPRIEVYGRDGTVQDIPIVNPPITGTDRFHSEFVTSFRELLRDYCAGTFRNPAVLFPECIKDHRMVFAAYKSAAEQGRKHYFSHIGATVSSSPSQTSSPR